MTVYEGSSNLYSWFSANDSFCMEKDYPKVVLISDEPEADKAAILSALDSFVELNIVRHKEVSGNNYWILNKSFSTLDQSPSLSPDTAMRIYEIIKAYSDITGDPRAEKCNILDIKGSDIEVMLDAIDIMLHEKK